MGRFCIITFLLLEIFCLSCNKEKVIREYYSDGKVKTEYSVVNNKIEGKYTVYYSSGKLQYQVNFENNLRNGIETEYYENGNVKTKGQCRFDKEYGRYYYYNEEQKLDSMIEYILVLDPDTDPFSYFSYDTLNREMIKKATVVENMYAKYDKNEEIIMDESAYCDVKLSKDSAYVGDSILATIFITCPMKNLRTDTLFVFLMDENWKKGIRYFDIKNPVEHYYSGKIAAGSGITHLNVFIHYSFVDGSGKNLFVKKPIYVY